MNYKSLIIIFLIFLFGCEQNNLNKNVVSQEIVTKYKNFGFALVYDSMLVKEKKVAEKAPVDGIQIDNLGDDNQKKKETAKEEIFSYIIKIADFYYKDSAKNMSNRIINETNIKNPLIKTISNTKYRVLLGPFNDIKKLEDSFNEIKSLNFENIEILKDV